jgi:uncharacterized delta-60 repeat protein
MTSSTNSMHRGEETMSFFRRRSRLWLLLAAAALVPACGDESSGGSATVGVPVRLPLSIEGDEQLQSATAGPGGSFYVAGFTSAAPLGPRTVFVAKVLATGLLDTTFGGGDGVVVLAPETPGSTGEIDIATQSSGKIVVSFTTRAVSPDHPDDRDLMVARLNADGTLDTTFGSPATGFARVNLSVDPLLADRDACRAIAVDPANNLIYLFGLMMSDAGEADLDFAIARLTADGVLDTTFGELDGGGPARLGRRFLDLATGQNATPRGIRVMADGSVLACGYIDEDANGGAVNTPQIVLWKLDTSGDPVAAFDGDGVWHENLLALQTEAYGFAVQGTQIVTGGYGRHTGTNNLWVTARFDIDDGDLDTTWGGAPVPGTLIVDPSGVVDETSNCRDALALPGGKTLLLGSTGPGNVADQDAAYAVLTSTGAVDPLYGGAAQVMSLGADGADQ